jgi:hypothetical protein
MSLPATDWLPANAVTDGVVTALVSERCNHWVRRWLTEPRAIAATAQTISQPLKVPSTHRLFANSDRTLALGLDQTSSLKLAAAILRAPAGVKLNAMDTRLYHRLSDKALSDLGEDLAHLFACSGQLRKVDGYDIDRVHNFSLNFAGLGPRLDVYADSALVLRARRSAARGSHPGAPLGDLSEAIGRQSVKVGAMIGAARLGLAELCGLGCGDVVVLDRRHDESVRLTIDGVLAEGAAARVERLQSSLTLRLIAAEPIQS